VNYTRCYKLGRIRFWTQNRTQLSAGIPVNYLLSVYANVAAAVLSPSMGFVRLLLNTARISRRKFAQSAALDTGRSRRNHDDSHEVLIRYIGVNAYGQEFEPRSV
jgi:hypothetical protein